MSLFYFRYHQWHSSPIRCRFFKRVLFQAAILTKPKMRRMNVVNRKQALKVVKELDAFPKVPEGYQQTSSSGGGGKFICSSFMSASCALLTVYCWSLPWNQPEWEFKKQIWKCTISDLFCSFYPGICLHFGAGDLRSQVLHVNRTQVWLQGWYCDWRVSLSWVQMFNVSSMSYWSDCHSGLGNLYQDIVTLQET